LLLFLLHVRFELKFCLVHIALDFSSCDDFDLIRDKASIGEFIYVLGGILF
jgi:hypothetical protein